MTTRVKLLVAAMVAVACYSTGFVAAVPSHHWRRFVIYLFAVLLSSNFKVGMPKSDRTMSVNFPFILLGILQLSPLQAIALGALSVFAQCRIKVFKPFTLIQTTFNVANVITATVAAWATFVFAGKHSIALAPALTIAAVTYFLTNTGVFAWVMGWSTNESPFALWRREFPWYLPFYFVGAALAAAAHLISLQYGLLTSLLLVPVVYTIYRAYQSQMKALQDRQAHLEETEALHLRTIEGLAMAIEAKDHNTHEHLLRVRVYVTEIGSILGLGKPETQALLTAALLHDIGKLAVPEHIINKPGKLTPEEFDKMKIHPIVGADILERVRFPYPVVPIVRSHHEAWDGTGYPDGLKGEEIPLGARILTVVDCFDALASDRPYRKALPLEKAIEFIKSKAGSQFDPEIVAILEKRYVDLERMASSKHDGLTPLNTDIIVSRGEAPGAGFQQENRSASRVAESLRTSTAETPKEQGLASAEMRQAIAGPLSPREAMRILCSRLQQAIPFDCLAMYSVAGENLHLDFIEGVGSGCFREVEIPIGEGLSGWVAHCGKSILNGNPKVEPHYVEGSKQAVRMASAISSALRDAGGNIVGALTLYSSVSDAFSGDHLQMLEVVEPHFSLSSQVLSNPGTTVSGDHMGLESQLPGITPPARAFQMAAVA